MTMSPLSPTASVYPEIREEVKRRRQAVQQALHNVLSAEDIADAVSLCDEVFPPSKPFSASMYCQHLVKRLPNINLTPIARLQLLRAIRQGVAEQGVESRTKVMMLPPELMQPSEVIEDTQPAKELKKTTGIEKQAGSQPQTEQKRQSQTEKPDSMATVVTPTPVPTPQGKLAIPFRKRVQFIGNYWANLDDAPTGTIVVTQLSQQNIAFKVQLPHQIKPGDYLSILFEIDDSAASTIWQSIHVHTIADDHIGGTWRNPDNLDDALKPYFS